jgi:arginase
VGVVLVEVPFNSSGSRAGVARMADALRDAGLHDALPALDHVIRVDVGDLSAHRGPSGFLTEAALVRTVTATTEVVGRAAAAGRSPLLVGGDCPVLLAPLAALAALGHRPALVMLDGHEDAWPPELSPSGEAADSELGLALGRYPGPAGLLDVLPVVRPDDVALLGPRDAAELRAAGCPSVAGEVHLVTGDELAGDPAADALEQVRRTVAAATRDTTTWWLHIDLDVLSTEALGAVDYPQPGGITWERLAAVTTAVLGTGGCAGASVVIYNPDLDGGASAPRIAAFVADLARRL